MRPRRTPINPNIKYFQWCESKGIDLARFDLGSFEPAQETKQSSFKKDPTKTKLQNHVFSFRNRIQETNYSDLEQFTELLITATP
jgi:hypothetical protein